MRLSTATLDRLPPDIARPTYDRNSVKRGVVHLGIGAFHRAHQAAVFDAALTAGDLRWGVVGVSLRSSNVRNQLMPQDGLYTMLVRDGITERAQVIGAVLDVLVAREDPAAVIAAIAAPDTHLVTLTVTEKGYSIDRLTGDLMTADEDVVHDLGSLDAPRTVPGLLVAGLAARRAPLTILSCDNLPHNGKLLRGAVLAMARAHDPELASWIAENIAFPASMVDRIVPATTPADIAALTDRTGIEDRAMVKTEPFLQWVVEDRFNSERPDFNALGMQLTDTVEPWEQAKLRLLNGAHSAIAYLGGLAGDAFVHQFVARPAGRAYVEALWDESTTTLNPPAGLDMAAYRQALMARFANPSLRHGTRQIAIDGSQKLPQRLIAPLLDRISKGLPADALTLAVAAWMRWQGGLTDAGQQFAIEDALAEKLAITNTAPDPVTALLNLLGIDPDPLTHNAIAAHLAILHKKGAIGAAANACSIGPADVIV